MRHIPSTQAHLSASTRVVTSGHSVGHSSPVRVGAHEASFAHHDTRSSVVKRVVISPGGTRREIDGHHGDGSAVDRFSGAYRQQYTSDGHHQTRVIDSHHGLNSSRVIHAADTSHVIR